nr:wax ester/triacylglycerol synthase domain-containing protein [Hoyosella altamirensis]
MNLTAFDDRFRDDPLDAEEVERYVASRLASVPYFQSRVQRTPLGLGNSHLVPVDDFDLSRHVKVREAPGSGSWAELRDELAELRETPLDPDLPPWHVSVVTGVRGVPGSTGRTVCVVTRLEHAVTDGAGSVALARQLFPDTPSSEETLSRDVVPVVPRRYSLLTSALMQVPDRVGRFTVNCRDALAKRKSKSGAPDDAPHPPLRGPAPETVIDRANGPLEYRAFAVGLAEIQRVRALAPGATINDIFIATVGGALRRYLGKFGEVPEEDLRCAITVATAKRDLSPFVGNDFTMAAVPFWIAVEDPIERLRCIVQSTRSVKERLRSGPKVPIERALQTVPPMFIPNILTKLSGGKSLVNAAVVNVPRGSRPMYFGQAKSVASFGFPFTDGVPVAHSVSSLGDVATVNVLYDSAAIRDGDAYQEMLEAELGAFLDLSA